MNSQISFLWLKLCILVVFVLNLPNICKPNINISHISIFFQDFSWTKCQEKLDLNYAGFHKMSDDLSIVINLATVQYLTLVSDRDPSDHLSFYLSIYLYIDGFTPIHQLSDHSSPLIHPISSYPSYILLSILYPPISSYPSYILLSILYPPIHPISSYPS